MSTEAEPSPSGSAVPVRAASPANMTAIIGGAVAVGVVIICVGMAIVIPIFRRRLRDRREANAEEITRRMRWNMRHRRQSSDGVVMSPLLSIAQRPAQRNGHSPELNGYSSVRQYDEVDSSVRSHSRQPSDTTAPLMPVDDSMKYGFSRPMSPPSADAYASKFDHRPVIPAPGPGRNERPFITIPPPRSSSRNPNTDPKPKPTTAVSLPIGPAPKAFNPTAPSSTSNPPIRSNTVTSDHTTPTSVSSSSTYSQASALTASRQIIDDFPVVPPGDDNVQSQAQSEQKPLDRADTVYVAGLLKSRVKDSNVDAPADDNSSPTSIYSGLSLAATIRRPARDPLDEFIPPVPSLPTVGQTTNTSAPQLIDQTTLMTQAPTPVMENPATFTYPDVPQDVNRWSTGTAIMSTPSHSHPPLQLTPPPLPKQFIPPSTDSIKPLPIRNKPDSSSQYQPPSNRLRPLPQQPPPQPLHARTRSDQPRFLPPSTPPPSLLPPPQPSHNRSRSATPDLLPDPFSRSRSPSPVASRSNSPHSTPRGPLPTLPPPSRSESPRPLKSALRTNTASPPVVALAPDSRYPSFSPPPPAAPPAPFQSVSRSNSPSRGLSPPLRSHTPPVVRPLNGRYI